MKPVPDSWIEWPLFNEVAPVGFTMDPKPDSLNRIQPSVTVVMLYDYALYYIYGSTNDVLLSHI